MRNPVDTESALVFRNSDHVGTITRTPTGSTFSYGPLALNRGGIAFNLQLEDGPFVTEGVNLHPFFANLLPEGLRLQALAKSAKTSTDDLLSLLMTLGDETVGDVWISQPGRTPELKSIAVDRVESIDFEEVREKLLSGYIEEEGIAGVQSKISAPRILTSFRGEKGGKSYLIKFSAPGAPMLVQNEHAIMALARKCRIEAAKTSVLIGKNGSKALLVERFDRTATGDRIHFEDLCQLLDLYPSEKYRVSVEDALGAIGRVCTAAAASKLAFLRVYVFSYIVGNGDLHAKNFGVIGSPDGNLVRQSPAYDLLTTLAYKELDQKRAMPFEGKRAKLTRNDVLAMAEIARIPAVAISRSIDQICATAWKNLDLLDQVGFSIGLLGSIKTEIRRRIQSLS